MGCSKFSRCKHSKNDCFANKKGLCICLSDTSFTSKDGKVKECTFYKPREEKKA